MGSDFDVVCEPMHRVGPLDRPIPFEDSIDPRFARGAMEATAWKYEAGDRRAE